ncbi:Inner membrane transport permease YbhR [Polystyrenella longa]|uniref:Inner membrane transport permease YbhR n=1 Tax=Polystyrenella longa TaxID=2528007 RepID=A0A518CJH3_9PLAN|nr:ABC transporter permease [Polystyrenella longa]QDU79373.1 Inner membrane transport permease YbhR [Polystyrenella longa]
MGGWNITKKDLLLLCRDGRALAVLLLLPMLFIGLIGMSVGPLFATGDEEKNKFPIAVLDQVDHEFDLQDLRRFDPPSFGFENYEELMELEPELDPVTLEEAEASGYADAEEELERQQKNSRMLTEHIINKIEVDRGFKVTRLKSAAEAEEWQQENVGNVLVVFGEEFWTRVETLESADLFQLDQGRMKSGLSSLDIYLESRSSNATRDSIVHEMIRVKVLEVISPYVMCETESHFRSMADKSVCEPYELNGVLPPLDAPAPVQKDPTKAQLNEAYIFIVPGFTVMFVFFLVNIMARSFLQEKHQGTLRRLQMAPLRPASVMVGKTVPFLLISLAQTILLFLFGRFTFGMSWGTEPLLLLPVIFFTSLAATGLGLVIALIVKTDSQVSSYSNLIVIMMAGVSGCIIPPEWMNSQLLRNTSLATPHYWSLNAFGEILKAETPSLSIVAESCGVLIAFSVFFFVLGSVLWRQKLAT